MVRTPSRSGNGALGCDSASQPIATANAQEASSCLFCKVAAGTQAASIVFQDENALVFLDHRPIFPGHCLLIPRSHFETLMDAPPEVAAGLIALARRLCAAMEEGLSAEGSFVAINNRISQSVPHLHIHVVPRRRKDGLKGFFWPRTRYRDDNEMESVRSSLEAALKV